MRCLACLLTFCCCVVSAAACRDAAEALREHLIFCSQFVIEDPDPGLMLDATQRCCPLAGRLRNCRPTDGDDTHR